MSIKLGVDVSSNNNNGTGIVDFNAIKAAGYDFAMVRVGYGTTAGGTFKGYISKSFTPQLTQAQAAGLEVGVYWWMNACSVEQAIIEAKACLDAIKKYRLTYPVCLDQEYNSPCGKWGVNKNRQLRTDMAKAFLETIQSASYYAMFYSSADWLNNWVYPAQLRAYDKWVADVRTGRSTPGFNGTYGIWQHSWKGRIPGNNFDIDLNRAYKDFPKLISDAGLNHLVANSTKNNQPEEQSTTSGSYILSLSDLISKGYSDICIKP